MLRGYAWPGNVRQLQSALFRAAVLCDRDALTPDEFPQIAAAVGVPLNGGSLGAGSNDGIGVTLYEDDGNMRPLEEIEADVIRLAIGHYRGRMTEVARRLGIGRSTLISQTRRSGDQRRRLSLHGFTPVKCQRCFTKSETVQVPLHNTLHLLAHNRLWHIEPHFEMLRMRGHHRHRTAGEVDCPGLCGELDWHLMRPVLAQLLEIAAAIRGRHVGLISSWHRLKPFDFLRGIVDQCGSVVDIGHRRAVA